MDHSPLAVPAAAASVSRSVHTRPVRQDSCPQNDYSPAAAAGAAAVPAEAEAVRIPAVHSGPTAVAVVAAEAGPTVGAAGVGLEEERRIAGELAETQDCIGVGRGCKPGRSDVDVAGIVGTILDVGEGVGKRSM